MKNKLSSFIYAIFLILVVVLFTNRFDNDGWFLLNSGRYVEQFGIPHVEPFTIHQNFHFVMHQWLFDLGLWKLYKLGGLKAMMAYNWIMAALFFFVYVRLVKLKIRQISGSVRFFLLLWLLLLSAGYLFQRPQTMSGLIFLLEIYLLERSVNQPRVPRVLIPLFFLLSVLLVNLHGAMWPMFTVFLLPYTFEALVGPHLPFSKWELTWKAKDFLLLFAAIVAGGFCSPYGTESMTYAFNSYGYKDINQLVSEMHPLSMDPGFPYLVIILVLLFFCTAIYARHSLPLRQQLLALGTGFMALQANRSSFLFLVAGLFPLADILADHKDFHATVSVSSWPQTRRMVLLLGTAALFGTWALFQQTKVTSDRCPLFLGAFGILLLMAVWNFQILWKERLNPLTLRPNLRTLFAALALLLLVPFSIAKLQLPREDFVLAKSVDVIQQDANGSPICLWTGYNDGPYAEFQRIPCYMDTRAEVFKTKLNHQKDVMEEYCSLISGKLDYRDFVTRYPFTHFLTTDLDPLYVNLKNDPRFELLWDSEEDQEVQEKATEVEKKKRVRIYKWRD